MAFSSRLRALTASVLLRTCVLAVRFFLGTETLRAGRWAHSRLVEAEQEALANQQGVASQQDLAADANEEEGDGVERFGS